MRILIVSEQIFSGAAGAQVARSAGRILREAGHEVAFLAQEGLPENMAHIGLVYRVTRSVFPAYAWGGGGQTADARQALEQFRPDMLHVISFGSVNGISWAVIRVFVDAGVPVVYVPVNYLTFCMNTYFYRPGAGDCQLCLGHRYHWGVRHQCGGRRGSYSQWLAMMLQRETVKRMSAFLSTCDDVDAAFVAYGAPKERILRTFHAFEWERVQGEQGANGTAMIFYGQGREEKGIHLFPELFQQVSGIRFDLYLWGSRWPGVERLRSDRNDVRVYDGITWTTGLRTAVAQARAAILPTVNRSFGELVVYEAMALGKPVIAFAAGANPLLIREGVDGLLVRTGDVEALAEAVRLLSDRPDMAVDLGKSAQERARLLWSDEAVYAGYRRGYNLALENTNWAQRYAQ